MRLLAMVVTAGTVGLIAVQWYSYLCTFCTYALKFFPKPDDVETIFMVKVAPHHYIVFWNLMRWMSGNSAWQDRTSTSKMSAQETSTSAEGTVVTTKVEQEISVPKETKDE